MILALVCRTALEQTSLTDNGNIMGNSKIMLAVNLTFDLPQNSCVQDIRCRKNIPQFIRVARHNCYKKIMFHLPLLRLIRVAYRLNEVGSVMTKKEPVLLGFDGFSVE